MKLYSGKLVGVLAWAILLCSSTFGQNGGLRFTLTDLGTFGARWSEAWAVNDFGAVVGTYGRNGEKTCFLWQGGRPQTFDGKTNPPKCEALAIDNKFNIAGRVGDEKTSAWRGFRWASGRLTILPPPPGYDVSMALGVWGPTAVGGVGNSSYSFYCDSCPFYFSGLANAVQWDANGVLTTIVTKNSGTWGNYARGVNHGQIVGVFYNYGVATPWLWKNGVFTYLPLASCSDLCPLYGEAFAINDSGSIAGGGSIQNADLLNGCAELWNSHSPASPPFLLPNCVNNDASPSGMAISGDNWVVGYGHWPWGSGYPPFLSVPDPSCVLTNLNTLLDASGTGWNIKTANGINSSHQIAGAGISPVDGELHAILLTPNNLPLCYPD